MLAVTIAGTVGVAGCGNSGNASSSTSTAPIKLMTIGPVSTPQFSLPSIPVGAQVAVDEINAAGGIDGRKLKLITCNDQNNPNTAAQCARQAIEEKVAGLVGGLETYDLQIMPLLEKAGIPWVGLTTPDDYTSSNLFLLGGEGAPTYTGIGLALAQQGCKKIAVVVTTAGGAEKIGAAQISAGVRAGGAQVAGTFTVPASAVDLASTVAAARSAGADCIGAGTGPAQSGPLITAVNAGAKLKLAFASGGLPNVVLQQLGKAADGVLAPAGYLPFTSTDGVVPQLKQKIQAKYPKVPLDQFAETGYASVKAVAQAAKGLKDVTGSSLKGALTKLTAFDTGLGPVADFSKEGSVPGFPRLFNPKIILWVAKDGDYNLAQPQPIDTTPALKLLSAK
ncbi:ABC transporter substrate-binding protein [Streptomyces prunicolor]|uniref:ABC transporter substrate-binding protein n=1 Tax=Streptomyces prunicolor TaxID=67348 RepID=UPI0038630EE5|nr:ABC transporter substrate-binding protein [Streptomyces prunicolor]